MRKKISIFTILLSIILFSGCSLFPSQESHPVKTIPVIPSAVGQNDQATTTSEISRPVRLVYENSEHGFMFKYTQNWKLDDERTNTSSVVFIDSNLPAGESHEAINFKPSQDDLESEINNFMRVRSYNEDQVLRDYAIKIGDEKTARIQTNEFGIVIYMFMHNSTLYTIETQTMFDDEALKSFRFLK